MLNEGLQFFRYTNVTKWDGDIKIICHHAFTFGIYRNIRETISQKGGGICSANAATFLHISNDMIPKYRQTKMPSRHASMHKSGCIRSNSWLKASTCYRYMGSTKKGKSHVTEWQRNNPMILQIHL